MAKYNSMKHMHKKGAIPGPVTTMNNNANDMHTMFDKQSYLGLFLKRCNY